MKPWASSQLTFSTGRSGPLETARILAHHRLPQRLGAGGLRQPEAARQHHFVPALVVSALRLVLGGAHQEPARRDPAQGLAHPLDAEGHPQAARVLAPVAGPGLGKDRAAVRAGEGTAGGPGAPGLGGFGHASIASRAAGGWNRSPPASFRAASARPTHMPGTAGFSPCGRDRPRGQDEGLVNPPPSGSVSSSGEAEADVVVAVAGIVVVAVGRAQVAPVVDPAPAAQHAVGALDDPHPCAGFYHPLGWWPRCPAHRNPTSTGGWRCRFSRRQARLSA